MEEEIMEGTVSRVLYMVDVSMTTFSSSMNLFRKQSMGKDDSYACMYNWHRYV